MQPCYEDKFEAVVLCSMVGDALGAPVEGWPASRIAATHGKVDRFLPPQHRDVPLVPRPPAPHAVLLGRAAGPGPGAGAPRQRSRPRQHPAARVPQPQ